MPSSCSRPKRGACAWAQVDTQAGARLERLPRRDGLRLALGVHRVGLAVVDLVFGRPVGGLADEDAVDRRGRLQAGSGVDHVARGHPLALRRPGAEGDQRLARVDGDPQLQLVPLLRHPVADRERRAHRALRVVLVRGRGAEERHHRVADELLDGAAEALELPAQVRVVRGEQPANVLGIELLGAGGEADEIGEEHRHDLALLARGCGRSLQRRTAGVAEPRGVRVLGRAAGADDHALSVRLTELRHADPATREPHPHTPRDLLARLQLSCRLGPSLTSVCPACWVDHRAWLTSSPSRMRLIPRHGWCMQR